MVGSARILKSGTYQSIIKYKLCQNKAFLIPVRVGLISCSLDRVRVCPIRQIRRLSVVDFSKYRFHRNKFHKSESGARISCFQRIMSVFYRPSPVCLTCLNLMLTSLFFQDLFFDHLAFSFYFSFYKLCLLG